MQLLAPDLPDLVHLGNFMLEVDILNKTRKLIMSVQRPVDPASLLFLGIIQIQVWICEKCEEILSDDAIFIGMDGRNE